jgi:hypothetical protein
MKTKAMIRTKTAGVSLIMQLIAAAAVISLLPLFSGCFTPPMKEGLMGANKPTLLDATHLPVYDYTLPSGDTNSYLYAYKHAGDGKSAADADAARKAVRNDVLNNLKAIVDYNYYDFEDGLRVDDTVKNTTADIVTLCLTAASTAAGAKEVKTILSAIATGVVGVNTSFDKNVFQSNTVQALQLEMRTLRSGIETDINHGMNDTDANYPLSQGIQDIIRYYYAGSLTDSLLGLVSATGTASTTTAKAADKARTETVTHVAVPAAN